MVGGVAALIVIVAVAWVLLVPLADWFAAHDVGPVTGAARALQLQTARDAARGRLLTLGAGLFAAAALIFTARNLTVYRESQVTDRYTKAIEQLGSDKVDVRLGAIYALERIARDSARDHPTVMEVLTAFIREHSREQKPPSATAEPGALPGAGTTRLPDVQAALTVIWRRDRRLDRQRIDLTGVSLHGVDLHKADLRDVDFTGTDMTSVNLDIADFGGATFNRARLVRAGSLGGKGASASFALADLTRAEFIYADLTRASFIGARLTSAQLMGTYFAGTSFIGADLRDADLRGTYLDGANFTDANLDGANLSDAKVTGVNLTRVKLTGAKWPEEMPVPEGWAKDPRSGRLARASKNANDPGN
jgi:hypothetical protein